MNTVSPEFYWLAFALVTIVSSARLTRLAIFDKYPPVMFFRDRFIIFTDKTDKRRAWQWLAFCPYCASPWLTLLVLIWADVAGVLDGNPAWGGDGSLSQPLWWIFNGWMAASYLAAVFMVRDADPEDNTDPDEDFVQDAGADN